MKLDAQHTSPVLPSLATKYFHLLLVSFWASLPSARLLPQRGLLVELECNYQSFELRKLSRFLFSMLGQKKVEQTWRWWFKLHPCCFSIFQVNEFQPTWWEMLCMISRGWPPQGLRKVASVSEPPKLAHCTHVAAGGHGHFQVSWINRGSWFFQSPRCLSNPMKHLCSQFSLLLMLVLFLNSYEAVVQGMSQEDVLC